MGLNSRKITSLPDTKTWHVISVFTENKPYAHHKFHLHTMKVFITRPVYSLTMEGFTAVLTCSKVINAFKQFIK